jgi:hypothetical protein
LKETEPSKTRHFSLQVPGILSGKPVSIILLVVTSVRVYHFYVIQSISKKFWEELIAYFHLTQHGANNERKN